MTTWDWTICLTLGAMLGLPLAKALGLTSAAWSLVLAPLALVVVWLVVLVGVGIWASMQDGV